MLRPAAHGRWFSRCTALLAGLLCASTALGTGVLRLVRSDSTGNGDPSLDLSGVELVAVRSALDE